MIAAKTADHAKVIYQYRLLKRLRIHPAMDAVYIMMPISFGLILQTLGAGTLTFWLWLIGAWAGWQLVYAGLTAALLHREGEEEPGISLRKYKARISFPWFGLLPAQGASYRQFRFIQGHLLVVGSLISASLWSWLPLDAAAAIGFAHLWGSLARMYVIVQMNAMETAGSLIVFSRREVDLYEP